jgi:glutamyl-tRNA synthetase
MVRTRFAPSPTGYLHIGGVRTALFNWLLARQSGGQFILRIDDTDQQRNVAAALQPILDGFRWLGLDWDEGPEVGGPHAPYYQSQRSDAHRAAAERLLANGFAYRDYALPEELQAQREAAEKRGASFVYDRRWAAESEQQAARWEQEGRKAVVRLKMPRSGACRIDDLVRGEVVVNWESEQDHVIQRADGTCLYHLASVVDDHDFGITHVVRAEEHLPNTPRQIFIATSLGYELPKYAHLPYVAEPGGTAKLSKRKLDKYAKQKDFAELLALGQRIAARAGLDVQPETFNPVIIDFYQQLGFLPDAILNYLLLLGWALDDRTERFNRQAMIEQFSLDRVKRAPASFDPQKLMAFQAARMAELDWATKVEMTLPFLQRAGLVADPAPLSDRQYLGAVLQGIGERLRVAGEILDYDYCFQQTDELVYDEPLFDKRLRESPETVELLRGLLPELELVEPYEAPEIEQRVKAYLERQQAKLNQIVHGLRLAATGRAVGFGMFETLAVLGRKECRRRIVRALQRCEVR